MEIETSWRSIYRGNNAHSAVKGSVLVFQKAHKSLKENQLEEKHKLAIIRKKMKEAL